MVKRSRGIDGRWFDYPAASTFKNVEDAKAYAESFAAEQTAGGVHGTAIDVRSRKGVCGYGRGALLATFKVG